MAVDAARRLAFDVSRAVEESDAYANLELARLTRARGLTGRDAAFAVELAAGTLRMQGAYDAILDHLVTRPLDRPVRSVLRMGCHQLLSMRVPAHAAVATSVSLTKEVAGHRPSGLVNAVLRRVSTRGLAEWFDELDASLAVRSSHPEWVVRELAAALAAPDELADLLDADNQAPSVTLVARPGRAERAELPGTPLDVSPYAVESAGGDPGAIHAVREHRAGVQDAGSQLVALALTEAPVAGPDLRWLDLCAGPGGKAALLDALADQHGALLVANERAPHRAELVRANGVPRVVCADGTAPAWRPTTFDRVLVDAPCSGLGALRRRPESRWRRRPEDLAGLEDLQTRLLRSAIASARPGGVVGYATCSPVVGETVGVVSSVVAETGCTVLDVPALLPWVENARSVHMRQALQLWPHRHGTDAMFLALLRVEG